MLRRVAAFLRPLLLLVSLPRLRSPMAGVLGLLVSFLRSRSPVVGVLGLCWMWHGVPWCAVCASAARSRWRIKVVLVVAGVV